jgi:hypothetical protein
MLGLPVDLRRADTVAEEIYVSGADTPTVDLRSLGLNYYEVEAGVRRFQDTNSNNDLDGSSNDTSDNSE